MLTHGLIYSIVQRKKEMLASELSADLPLILSIISHDYSRMEVQSNCSKIKLFPLQPK